MGLDTNWLKAELAKRQLMEADNVLLAQIDTDGSLYEAEQPPMNYLNAFFVGEGKDKSQESK